MKQLAAYEKRLRKYTPERQEKDILAIVKKHTDLLIDINTIQLMHGKDTDDNLLEHYRNEAYADFKMFLNPLGVTDLFLTGKFHRSIFVKTNSFPVTWDARDKKKEQLVAKYGKILGISAEGKIFFLEHIQEEIKQYYDNIYRL